MLCNQTPQNGTWTAFKNKRTHHLLDRIQNLGYFSVIFLHSIYQKQGQKQIKTPQNNVKFESLNIKVGPTWLFTLASWLGYYRVLGVSGSTSVGGLLSTVGVSTTSLTTTCYDRPPPKTIHCHPHFRSGNGSTLLLK